MPRRLQRDNVAAMGCAFLVCCDFRRSLFAIGQDIFQLISWLDAQEYGVQDEILVAGLMVVMAAANLRAQIRPFMSMSDASGSGGSAAEAP